MYTRVFDLGIGKVEQFMLALQNAGLTVDQVGSIIDNTLFAKKLVAVASAIDPVDHYNNYRPLLYSLERQKSALRELNNRISGEMRIPDSWIEKLDTKSDHVQKIEDLESFFVVKETVEETLKYQAILVNLNNIVGRSPGMGDVIEHLKLDRSANSSMYERPGVYRVRINLVDNWHPSGTIVSKARTDAAAIGNKLAGLPAIGAYALQDPRLVRALNGRDLPYIIIADISHDIFSSVYVKRYEI